MTATRRFYLILFFAFFQLHAFAQQPRVVVANSSSKELKYTAHRLRIPIEQLKNAREALKETTELAETMDPFPMNQLSNLARLWQILDKSRAQGVIDGFIQDLREKAANAADYNGYQQATSTATSILQSQMSQSGAMDYDKILELLNSWPDPPSSLGSKASDYRKILEDQIRSQTLSNMANSDPEKAYELLSQSKNILSNQPYLALQIAQGLMNKGKKEEAITIIDQTATRLMNDPQSTNSFSSFGSTLASYNIPGTDKILEKWVAQMMNSPQQSNCAARVQQGQMILMEITCSESTTLNAMRNIYSRPGLLMKILNSAPALKALVDRIGGIDSLSYSYPGGLNFITYNPQAQNPTADARIINSNIVSDAGTASNSPDKLLQELKGKAEKSPSLVREKLRGNIKGPESIDMLINLASISSYQEPELANIALDLAQELLPQVDSLQRRMNILQNLVRMYRQVSGEVDPELLKTGFILADQLRQEQLGKNPAANQSSQWIYNSADQLESFLLSELSRDSFDMAMHYVRTLENPQTKLNCLTQIVQALSQRY